MRKLLHLAAIAAAAFLASSPAFAVEVDFSPVTKAALDLAAPVLVGVLSWAVHQVAGMVRARLKISIDQATEDRLNANLARAISYGVSRAQTAAGTRTAFEIKNETVAHAAGYAIEYFPSLLKHFEIDPATLGARIEARLAEHPAAAGIAAAK